MQNREEYTEILSCPLSKAAIDLIVTYAGDDPMVRIIANLSNSYPELIQELSELHEDLYKASSPGFRSATKKILR